MKDFYNVFGQLVSTNDYEHFSDTNTLSSLTKDQLKDYINNFKQKVEQGILSKEKVVQDMKELREISNKKETPEDIKKLITEVGKTTIRQVDGLRLEGNLEVGGVMKSKGFYLQDGTKINEVTKVVNKLAVPIDKQGNLNLKTEGNKKVNVNNLNIPKSGRITFGAGEDNDPYHLRKIGNADSNHLRLTLNDNTDESLQIWGDSCRGDKCKPDGGTQKHAFFSNGDVHHSRSAYIKGDIIKHGGNNWIIHTPDDKRHTLYIAPSRTKGKNDWNWEKQTRFESTGEVVFNEGKHSNYNRHGYSTHFNHRGQGINYIRGQTNIDGEVNFNDKTKGVTIHNGKHSNFNKDGHATHFNLEGRSLNYIRGQTELRGEVNFVDTDRGINIHQKKTSHNPEGWGTHFNHGGGGRHYIRGRTEIRGPSVDVTTNSFNVRAHGRFSSFGSHNSGWCHITTTAPQFYMNKGLQVNGPISSYHNAPLNCNRGVNAYGYRNWFKDIENKGRVRVGAAWGIPGLYSEDGQDLVLGVANGKKVKLGYKDKFAEVDTNGNIHLPAGAKIFIGGKEVMSENNSLIKHGDKITLASTRNNRRLQNSGWYGVFGNTNQGGWETMKIEKCGLNPVLTQNNGTARCSQ